MKNLISITKEIIKNKKGKILIPSIIYGLIGLDAEVIYRALMGDSINYDGLTYLSLFGRVSLWMFFVYALGCVLISILNEYDEYYELPMIIQSFVNGLLVTTIELLSGVVFNLLPFTKLNLWYYTDKFNILHQVCLRNYIVFTLSMPFVIWLCDTVGWVLYKEDCKYNILDNYKQLLKELKIIK